MDSECEGLIHEWVEFTTATGGALKIETQLSVLAPRQILALFWQCGKKKEDKRNGNTDVV